IQEFLIIHENNGEDMTEEPNHGILNAFKWTGNNTRLLIDLYAKYRTKVGTMEIRSLKQMWELISKNLSQQIGIAPTPSNCEKRWKVLDRNFKKHVDNQNSTGRGKNISNFMKTCLLFLIKKTYVPN
ncbi:hypothetical protein ABEB36_008337, partial [Hypothenemus hampei]